MASTITPNYKDAWNTGLSIIPVQTIAKGNLVSGFLDLLNSTSTQAALSAVVSTGGSNYAVGDTITLTGGTFAQAIVLTVLTVSAGAVSTVAVTNRGSYSVLPSNPVSQGSTSGSGSSATFTVTWLQPNLGFNARIFCDFGKGGTTALSNGANLNVYPQPNLVNGQPIYRAGSGLTSRSQNTNTASSTTISTTSIAGQNNIVVVSATGFAAGDDVIIQDSGGGVTRTEWKRISKISGTTITFTSPLEFTHTSVQADTVRNKADTFTPFLVPGGSILEFVVDYGAETTADNLTARVFAQLFPSLNAS